MFSQWLRAAPFHGFLVQAGVGERLALVVTVRRGSAEIALVPGFERSKLRLGRSCANRVETEETDRIEASVRVAAMSEFLRIARYFLFSHRFCYTLTKRTPSISLPQTLEAWRFVAKWRIRPPNPSTGWARK